MMRHLWPSLIVSLALLLSACDTQSEMEFKPNRDTKDDSGRTLKDLHRNGVTRPAGVGGFGR